MGEYEELRRAHADGLETQAQDHLQRLWWDADRLRAQREQDLAGLLGWARERSKWHSARLAGIDLDACTEERLGRLPTMTKTGLTAHFDEIVTDPRLSRRLVDQHVRSLGDGDGYLLEEYHAVATSGTSGRPAVVVSDRTEWLTCFATIIRSAQTLVHAHYPEKFDPSTGHLWEGSVVRPVFVGPGSGANLLRAAILSLSTEEIATIPVSAEAPLPAQVAQLNKLKPDVLQGPPSVLQRLAAEAQAGRLNVAPFLVMCLGEPLSPQVSDLLAGTWQCPVGEVYTLTEFGGVAGSCVEGNLHLADDLLIVEPVDQSGRPVPPGTTAAKWYLTNLYNRTTPLIRYEVDDPITIGTGRCPCGSSLRTVTVGASA